MLLAVRLPNTGARRWTTRRGEQRSVAISAARVHDEAGGLVHDDDRRILVHDRQRDVLRRVGERGVGIARDDVEALAAGDAPLRFPHRAVDVDAALVDPGLQAAARLLGEESRQRLIEAEPREIGRHQVAARRRIAAFHVSVARGASAIIRAVHEGCGR